MKKLIYLLTTLLIFQINVSAQTVEFSDDFESGTSKWVLQAPWGLTTTQANSGSNSLTDSPAGNYAANRNITATMANGVDLSGVLDAELKFFAIYEIEDGNFDYCYVEASGDGGTTWLNVATFFGEGNLTPWTEYTYNLGGFVGKSDVKVRFRFFSDGGYEVDGIYIDDVQIISSNVDNGVPLILHTPPVLYESTPGDVVLVAELIDVSGIDAATLIYTVDGGAPNSLAGVNFLDDFYGFIIPEQAAGAQVDYYIEVSDASTNMNMATTSVYSYIAGQHFIYDNGVVDFVNSFGPAAASGATGAAVRFSLFGNDIKYALIRNYTDNMRPNSPMMFHIWADNNGLPGADMITPFMITAEANMVNNSPMTRVDLSAYAAELSNITGDVFMGYTVPAGQTWLVQTTPAVGGRTYVMTAGAWAANPGDDYHFRLVTTRTDVSDDCATATDINSLLGGALDVAVSSPVFNNDNATTDASDPATGFDCFGEPDGGGATPSLENTQWFTFTGDGELYSILTTDCNGTVSDYVDFGDTQIAIYSGTDCSNLTPVDCNEDVAGSDPNGPYPAGLDFQTEDGVTYFMMVDGFLGSDGDYCIEFTRTASVTCDDIALGTASTDKPFVCIGDTTSFMLAGTTVIPPAPISQFRWGIYTEDISGSTNPFNEPSAIAYFGNNGSVYTPRYVHTGALPVPSGTYFFTPIVFAGAVDTAGSGTLGGLSFENGCVITGNSVEVTLVDQLTDLAANTNSTDETIPPGNNGEASVAVSGGSDIYTYLWSNGGTTAMITGLPAGDYTVTVSDATGCVDDLVMTVTVGMTVGIGDVEFEQALRLFPNPANQQTSLHYNFADTRDLNISISNSMGQQVYERQLANTQSGILELELKSFTDGVYFVKMSDGENQSVRRLVISR